MNAYVESGISILNDTTKDLKNLNELGIYLAKQTDIDALKSLKLLILASRCRMLDKDFDVNGTKSYVESFLKEECKKNESIIGNLSVNPQNIALEIMDYVLHNYQVNLSLEPFSNGYTIVDYFIRSLARIEYDQDIFYKRYDMIDKKLDMISYMLQTRLLNSIQIEELISLLDVCIKNKYSYSEEQLLKIQEIINKAEIQNQFEGDLVTQNAIEFNDSREELGWDRIKNYDELANYIMLNDQCIYMVQTIPTLVKQKIIK